MTRNIFAFLGDAMHIPDGYLGPGTFIAFWIIMIPIWIYVGKKMRNLGSKRAPLLALASAFAFVIMMFNLPVPGGSSLAMLSGQTIIAVVIGPMGYVLSHIYSSGTTGATVWRWRTNCLCSKLFHYVSYYALLLVIIPTKH